MTYQIRSLWLKLAAFVAHVLADLRSATPKIEPDVSRNADIPDYLRSDVGLSQRKTRPHSTAPPEVDPLRFL